MTTGTMRERIIIQAETRTPNGQGGWTDLGWVNLPNDPNPWAEITGLSGDESINVAVERAVTQWRVVTRERSDVTPQHRIVWDGLIMEIVSVMPLPKDPRSFTLMICESGLSADGS